MEEQQGEKEIHKHVDEFEAATEEIQQQQEELLKSLGVTKDRRIESANAIKQ